MKKWKCTTFAQRKLFYYNLQKNLQYKIHNAQVFWTGYSSKCRLSLKLNFFFRLGWWGVKNEKNGMSTVELEKSVHTSPFGNSLKKDIFLQLCMYFKYKYKKKMCFKEKLFKKFHLHILFLFSSHEEEENFKCWLWPSNKVLIMLYVCWSVGSVSSFMLRGTLKETRDLCNC